MNLSESLSLERLRIESKLVDRVVEKRTAVQVAKRIFKLAAEAGHPYEGITSEQWAKKWLASKEFVLMDVETDRVALLRPPRNEQKVLAQVQASRDAMEPIVVDLNKRQVGRTPAGFIPQVIAVDGAHRYQTTKLQGRDTIRAWVGVRAVDRVWVEMIQASAVKPKDDTRCVGTKITAAAELWAGGVPRQDVGDGGSQPTMRVPTVQRAGAPDGTSFKKNRGVVEAQDTGIGVGPRRPLDVGFRPSPTAAPSRGAGGSSGIGRAPANPGGQMLRLSRKKMKGGTGGAGATSSGMNPGRIGFAKVKASDVDPSDREAGKEEVDPSDRSQSPDVQAPGAGVGRRLPPSKGASRSEMQKKLNAKGRGVCAGCHGGR